MIKLFASDLDGTLLNALHEVDKTILHALDETLKSGRHVVLATGRFARTSDDLGVGSFPIEVISSNGALIMGRDAHVLHQVLLNKETLAELFNQFPTTCFACLTQDGIYTNGTVEELVEAYFAPRSYLDNLFVKRTKARVDRSRFFFEQSADKLLNLDICKINTRANSPSEQKALNEFFSAHTQTIVNASSDGALIELTDPEANKATAVAWLAQYLDIQEDEVAVYGDGGNDLSMISRFEHSYATKGAIDEVKDAASTVLGSCTFHAVAHHMLQTIQLEGSIN